MLCNFFLFLSSVATRAGMAFRCGQKNVSKKYFILTNFTPKNTKSHQCLQNSAKFSSHTLKMQKKQLKATFYLKKILSTKPEVVQCKKNLIKWKRKCEAKTCSWKLVDKT